MKNVCIKIVSLIITIAITFSSMQTLTFALEPEVKDEKISVIVALSENTDIDSALKSISSKIPDIEYKDTYSVLFHGFSALVPSSKLAILSHAFGVERLYENTEYEAMSLEENSANIVYAPGLEPAYYPERGSGSVVAVIDDGFYLKHELFTLGTADSLAIIPKDIDEILHFTNASRLYPNIKVKSVYKSEKIPFAFDYADRDTDVYSSSNHGTAMLSLAAGNPENGEVVSAAPSAQVLAMKVYSDSSREAKTSDIVAALEDAYVLGADSVCLSLGSPCGFSEYGLYDNLLEEVIERLHEKEVCVVCPVGNDSALGAGSVFDKHYGYFEPLTALPDSGTVSAPASFVHTLSVASSSTFLASAYALRLSNGTYIPFSDSNHLYNSKPFYSLFNAQTLEYVVINGLGKEEDFTVNGTPLDLSGKIALIKRGELNFTDKVNNAAKHGAAAVIIYDNSQSDTPAIRTSMQLEGALLPAILISNTDGEKMKAATLKQIYVDSKIKYVTDAGITPSVSPFSSKGPTPTLDVKPELAASGSEVLVANKNGSYSTISGTSASGAYVAGLSAAVSVGLKDNSGCNRADRTKAILMNLATPMRESDSAQSRLYGVTLQGAGHLADGVKSLEADICITSHGQAKILLGNKLDNEFDIELTLENLTDKEKAVRLSAILGTESYESIPYSELCRENDSFYKQNSQMLYEYLGKDSSDTVSFTGNFIDELEGAAITYEGKDISSDGGALLTLAPRESVDIKLNVKLDPNELDTLSCVFENGMIIQGYVFAECEKTYSIPMLGFYGDFYAADPFDSLLGEAGGLFGGTYLYTYFADDFDDYTVVLGTNYDIEKKRALKKIYPELCVVSPIANGAEGAVFLRVNLTRNLKSLRADIYSKSGEYISSAGVITSLKKAYLPENESETNTYRIELWDIRDKDNKKFIYDDGIYTCRVVATDASDREFIKNFDFTVDSEKPEISSYSTRSDKGRRYLDLVATDNTYIKEMSVVGVNNAEIECITGNAPDDEYLSELGVGGEFCAVFDVTDYVGQYVYVEIVDLTFNKSLVRIRV
ncbi:MAG: hypothetical protein E7635_01365 [Ruminococcaceae bacterium]|nr:hypothetical protein [Oscillospiraceae bacterium]